MNGEAGTMTRDALTRELIDVYAHLFRITSERLLDDRILDAYGLSWENVDGETIGLDVSRFVGARAVMQLFGYAVEGRGDCFSLDMAHEAYTLLDVAEALEFDREKSAEVMRSLHALTDARLKLDVHRDDFSTEGLHSDDPLYLTDLALLASMNERSVRNLTLASAGNERLETYTDTSGRVCVAPDVALAWLRRRRGFKETMAHGTPKHVDVILNDAAIRNGYLHIPGSLQAFFPDDSLGNRRGDAQGRPILLEAGTRTYETDIRDFGKETRWLSPRRRLGKYFKSELGAQSGDSIRIHKIGERHYKLEHRPKMTNH